jgi:hypothetical protein
MFAQYSLKPGFQLNSISLASSKLGSTKKRVALSSARANSSYDSDKNTKGSEDLGANVTLKIVPALLSEKRGVGVIATVGVIAAAKLAQAVSLLA